MICLLFHQLNKAFFMENEAKELFCDICNKQFNRQDNLRRLHIST